MTEAIEYRVDLHDPAAHRLRVTCRIPSPDPEGQTV